ncbi:MEKHLA domain-containing protein [bacterium]|nr:MEKHLA domain-containing protein [bacterium]
MSAWIEHHWVEHSQILLNSYARWVGEELVDREGDVETQARRLFEAPFVVVSHGTQADPLLNYANQTALDLWQVDVPTLLTMPSRTTAEPMHRDERARLLERTTRDGYVDDYRGIRIASTGRQFLIERATVWNLLDNDDQYVGQAATFSEWKFLDD